MKKNISIILVILTLFVGSMLTAGVTYVEYEVKDGETFLEVCENFLLDCSGNWQELLRFNGLRSPKEPIAGKTIKIPNSLSKNRYAMVQFMVGDVEVYNEEANDWSRIRANHVLVEGNVLKTSDGAKCEIKLDDGTLLKLDSNSVVALGEFSYDDNKGSNTLLDVIAGTALMKVTKLGGDDSFNVKTVSAVAGVRGTEFSVTVSGEGEDAAVELTVLRGEIGAKASDNPDAEEYIFRGVQPGTQTSETTAETIVEKEGGVTNFNVEKTIGVREGYTVVFNRRQDKAIVTRMPEQIKNVVIEEVND